MKFVCIVLLAILCLWSAAVAAQEGTVVVNNITVYRKANPLFFSKFFSLEAPAVKVEIVKPLPTNGKLIAIQNGSTVVCTGTNDTDPCTSQANMFLYEPLHIGLVLPAEDSINYVVRAGVDSDIVLQTRLKLYIVNRPPEVYDMVYSTEKDNRTISLYARDRDEPRYISKDEVTEGESQEIAGFRVNTQDGPCKLYDSSGALVTLNTYLPKPYRVVFVPPSSASEWTQGSTCKFTFQAQDRSQEWSNEATITLNSSPPNLVRAFGARVRARVGVDDFVWVSLFAVAKAGIKGRRFFITALPSAGTLHAQLPSGAFDHHPLQIPEGANKLDVSSLSRTRSARLTFAYRPPKLDNVSALPDAVVVKYYMQVGSVVSNEATVAIELIKPEQRKKLECGTTVLDPVFANKPYGRIKLNYTKGDNNVRGIAIIQAPRRPIGDFYAAMSRARQRVSILRLGTAFNDERQTIFHQARRPATDFPVDMEQKYRFIVQNYNKESCIGTIIVKYRRHERLVTATPGPGDKLAEPPVFTRWETARVQRLTLIPLRGLANRTIISGLSSIAGVRMISVPQNGRLYQVKDTLPFARDQYAMACERINCAEYITGKAIQPGDFVPMQMYDSDPNDDNIDAANRTYVLYAGPMGVPADTGTDTFRFRFVSSDDQTTANTSTSVQEVVVKLRDSSHETLYFYYTKNKRSRIELKLSNKTAIDERIRIIPKYRHGRISGRYRLFQYAGSDGRRPIPGDEITPEKVTELSPTQRVPGLWVTDEQNKVILTPEPSTHRKRFTFYMERIPVLSNGQLDEASAHRYRVRVKRRNTPPSWDISNCTDRLNCVDEEFNRLNATDRYELPFIFAGLDRDDDSLTYVVTKAPRYGFLKYEMDQSEGAVWRRAPVGMRIRGKKNVWGEGFRDVLMMTYRHRPGAVLARTDRGQIPYPVIDRFTIVADDGVEPSEPMTVKIRIDAGDLDASIMEDRKSFHSRRAQESKSSLGVGIAVGVTLTLIGVLAVIIARQKESARRRYMALPAALGPQPQAGAGKATEMKPPTAVPASS